MSSTQKTQKPSKGESNIGQPSQAGSSSTPLSDGAPDPNRKATFKDLKMFTDEQLRQILKSKIDAIHDNLQENAGKVFKPGLIEDDGVLTFLIPENLMLYEDNYLPGFLSECVTLCKGVAYSLPEKHSIQDTYKKSFIRGLWFGLTSTDKINLNERKSNYELGRTCAFGLRIRAYFQQNKNLGLKALKHNNAFFGNGKSITDNKELKPFIVRSLISSFFTDPDTSDLVYGALNRACNKVSLYGLDDELLEKVITENVIPFDQVVASHYRITSTQKAKSKKSTKKVVKPNIIRKSPLLTEMETNVLKKYTDPFFSDLDDLNKRYITWLRNEGFDYVCSEISKSIRLRWQILSKFAKMTKNRLQILRKVKPEYAKIRKAQVTITHLEEYLSQIPSPDRSLLKEILDIVPDDRLLWSISASTKYAVRDRETAQGVIFHSIREELRKDSILKAKISGREQDNALNIRMQDFNESMNCLQRIETQLAVVAGTTRHLDVYGENDFASKKRIKSLVTNFELLRGSITSLKAQPKDRLELALYVRSGGKETDSNEVITKMESRIRSARSDCHTAIESCINFTSDQALIKLGTEALNQI